MKFDMNTVNRSNSISNSISNSNSKSSLHTKENDPNPKVRQWVKWFAVTKFARNNKWVALPLLSIIGAAGAFWAFISIIVQGLITFEKAAHPLENETNFLIALFLVFLGICTGLTEILRVVGKQLIASDAFKVECLIQELATHALDPEIKHIANCIVLLLPKRQNKDSQGEYEVLFELENIDKQKEKTPIDFVKAVLKKYYVYLAYTVQTSYRKNLLINDLIDHRILPTDLLHIETASQHHLPSLTAIDNIRTNHSETSPLLP